MAEGAKIEAGNNLEKESEKNNHDSQHGRIQEEGKCGQSDDWLTTCENNLALNEPGAQNITQKEQTQNDKNTRIETLEDNRVSKDTAYTNTRENDEENSKESETSTDADEEECEQSDDWLVGKSCYFPEKETDEMPQEIKTEEVCIQSNDWLTSKFCKPLKADVQITKQGGKARKMGLIEKFNAMPIKPLRNKIFLEFGIQDTFIGTILISLANGQRVVDANSSLALNGLIGYNRILSRRFSISIVTVSRGRAATSFFYLGHHPSTTMSVESALLTVSLGINILQNGGFFMSAGIGLTTTFVHITPVSTTNPAFKDPVSILGIGIGIAPRITIGYRIGRNTFTASLSGTMAPELLIMNNHNAFGFTVYTGLFLTHSIKLTELFALTYSLAIGAVYLKSVDPFSKHDIIVTNYYTGGAVGMSFSF